MTFSDEFFVYALPPCFIAPIRDGTLSSFVIDSFSCHQPRIYPQGETDAMKEDDARTYDERFQTLVTDVRALGYPDLRFFTVAITGTTARLPYLDKVRFCLAFTISYSPRLNAALLMVS